MVMSVFLKDSAWYASLVMSDGAEHSESWEQRLVLLTLRSPCANASPVVPTAQVSYGLHSTIDKL
jgi:hypothetical protein